MLFSLVGDRLEVPYHQLTHVMFHVYNGNNACACACDSKRWLPQLSDGSHMQSLYTLLVPTSNMMENRRTDNVTISNDLHFLSFKKKQKRFRVAVGLYSNRSQKTSNCSRADITVINLRVQFSSGKHKNQAFLTFADWRRFVPFSIIACDRGGTDSLIARTTNEPYRLSMSKISAPQSSVWRCSRFGTWCYGVKAISN